MMTEADALRDIFTWSSQGPGWQGDAFRRLVTQESLTSTDIDELVAICKGEQPAVLLNKNYLQSSARNRGDVCLRRVYDVQNVNALAPGQKLAFNDQGLTVVYGDNGSGKSGYTRILKKICRARVSGQVEEIKPNIYEDRTGEAQAKIEYTLNGQRKTCELGAETAPALPEISVFDSRAANIHVDKANGVAYTPFPLKVLDKLAQLCIELEKRLTGEIAQIEAQTPEAIRKPAFTQGTQVGRLMGGLAADTSPAEVERLTQLTQEEQDRLTQLGEDLARDPTRVAHQLNRQAKRLREHIERFDALFASITEDAVDERCRLFDHSEATQQAAQAASEGLFHEEPLPHIGTTAWQELWKSARAFSNMNAYPHQHFPVTEAGSVCVLCQQELTPVAADRLRRFDAFVSDDSQKRAQEARSAYENAVATFEKAAISLNDMRNILAFFRDDLGLTDLTCELRKAALRGMWCYRQVKRSRKCSSDMLRVVCASYPRLKLLEQVSELERRAKVFTLEAHSDERAALRGEKNELQDRQWLGGIKADILAEIERKKRIACLEKMKGDTKTRRVTKKSTEIAQALVTEALCEQFFDEMARFGIDGLEVELRPGKSAKGIPQFKVALKQKTAVPVKEVLSEGEYRCVALAAFMAELATAHNKSGIVFDDPVSSLDHNYRNAVARRLITESTQRQVIIFTHDLAFLFELNQVAQEREQNIHGRSITRAGRKVGLYRDHLPSRARPVFETIKGLRKHLSNVSCHSREGRDDQWQREVKYLAAALRDEWEKAVEEAVSPVLRRFSNKVNTPGLVKLTVITEAQCEMMRTGFQRCSRWLHSSGAALNPPLPRPDELETEISVLEDWIGMLRKRQENVKKER